MENMKQWQQKYTSLLATSNAREHQNYWTAGKQMAMLSVCMVSLWSELHWKCNFKLVLFTCLYAEGVVSHSHFRSIVNTNSFRLKALASYQFCSILIRYTNIHNTFDQDSKVFNIKYESYCKKLLFALLKCLTLNWTRFSVNWTKY